MESAVSSVVLYVNGRRHTVSDVDAETTLLQFLRDDRVGLYGTKYGCGEGGCGACTVMVSSYDPHARAVRHRAVNGCLAPLYSLDGCAVTTVEGIGSSRTALHPVQERLAESHGSQCGFCTPGIVMSLYVLLRNHPEPSVQQIEDCFAGNLCRCTGYRPILDAAKSFSPEASTLVSQEIATAGCGEGCTCVGDVHDTDDTISVKGMTVAQLRDKYGPYLPDSEPVFPLALKNYSPQPIAVKGRRCSWYRPTTMEQLLRLKHELPSAKVVVGATEIGVEIRVRHLHYADYIHPVHVHELMRLDELSDRLVLGAGASLTDVAAFLRSVVGSRPAWQTDSCRAVLDQLRYFAGPQIRNVACLAGNVVTASPISDLNPVFMAMNAKFVLRSLHGGERKEEARTFFVDYRKTKIRPDEILVAVELPLCARNEHVFAYKTSRRREDDIAIVNACFRVVLGESTTGSGLIVEDVSAAFGGMSKTPVCAPLFEETILSQPWIKKTVTLGGEALLKDMPLPPGVPGGMPEFRRSLAVSFFFKFFLQVCAKLNLPLDAREASAVAPHTRPPSKGSQFFDVNMQHARPVGMPIAHAAADIQVTGEAQYTHDMPSPPRCLYARLVLSKKAHAKIRSIDVSPAEAVPGFVAFFTHKDIRGTNICGAARHDELIFAEDEVVYVGHPIGLVCATTEVAARDAADAVRVHYQELPAIITIDDAIAAGSFIEPTNRLQKGDVEAAFASCDRVIEGRIRMGGQEHFYLETNACVCVPGEKGEMTVWSSTQNPALTQLVVSRVLDVPANRVVCKVKRLGGGFGGKEARTVPLAAACAVAAHSLNVPVRMTLERDEDMLITGGRHPYLGVYKLGFMNDGRVVAADVQLYHNSGFSLDLSAGVMDRSLFHIDNVYNFPHLRVAGYKCLTNMPSNTAFRGFGAPQAMFVCETMMEHMAHECGLPAPTVRELNFYRENDRTHFGQELDQCLVRDCWDQVLEQSDYAARLQEVRAFNEANRYKKRGVALTPTKYGMSFTAKFLNQAGALVHIYQDGNVLVTHGGCEMGQGLHTKIIQIAAAELGIPFELVHVSETATDKVANAAPTAASVQSDLNGMAVHLACSELRARLAPLRADNPDMPWPEICRMAFFERIDLSAHGFYRTPDLDFSFETGVGRPFNYFNYGAACSVVEIDTLTGDFEVLRSDVVMDVGFSLNPSIDIGQVEGAFVQGLGLFTMEELVWHHSGALMSRGPGAYKIPSFTDIPVDFRVSLLRNRPNARAVHSSKGVGEPPLFLSCSVLFAIRNAMMAARQEMAITSYFPLHSPATCERIRMGCVDACTQLVTDKDHADKPECAW